MSQDVSIEALQDAIRHLHKCASTYVETVHIVERSQGKVAWEGDVKVFSLIGHAGGAPRAYTWSYPTTGTKRRFVAVLHMGSVFDSRTAVQATISAEAQRYAQLN